MIKRYLLFSTLWYFKIKYEVLELGKNEILIKYLDEDVLTINNDTINAKNIGRAKVAISNNDIKKHFEVVVTDLINKMPKEYDYNKKSLSCNNIAKKKQSY